MCVIQLFFIIIEPAFLKMIICYNIVYPEKYFPAGKRRIKTKQVHHNNIERKQHMTE